MGIIEYPYKVKNIYIVSVIIFILSDGYSKEMLKQQILH